MTPALEACAVDKWFGRNHANRAVSLAVTRGSIHGLIGENGAGKSTLMNIFYGYLPADRGEVRVHGHPVRLRSPRDAIAAGIGMVHQHFMLVEPFTVLENILLGAESGPVLETARTRADLLRLGRDHGLEVDPDAVVGDLAVGVRQRVEILKALHRGADILILDEPTGVLTPPEIDQLFRILSRLRDQGKTILLITHKLREILALTDSVTVMRRGAVVATLATADTCRESLAEMMVGRPVRLHLDKAPFQPGAPVLAVENLTVTDADGAARVRGLDFQVRAGEIVGIAGVAGNGQSELLEALAGMRPVTGGRVWLKGEDITRHPDRFTARGLRRAGVGHVPEDRQRQGLITAFTAAENVLLGHHDDRAFNGRLLRDDRAVTAHCRRLMADYDVRPPEPELTAASLSGGNQQKLVLAREIERDPDLLLIGQPTRGVDIGAVEFIHRRLIALRDAGKAILLVSSELEEILALADRILVMVDGRLVGTLPGDRPDNPVDERQLGLLMAGAAPGLEVLPHTPA